MSSSGKVELPLLGLTVTTGPLESGTGNVADNLTSALLDLLQSRGNPMGKVGEILQQLPSDAKVGCPIATCIRLSLYHTVLRPVSTFYLELMLQTPTFYEPWEVQHMRMTLAFIRGELDYAISLGEASICNHPTDMFTGRALLVMYVLTSEFGRMQRTFCGMMAAMTSRQQSNVPFNNVIGPFVAANAAFGLVESGFGAHAELIASKAVKDIIVLNAEIRERKELMKKEVGNSNNNQHDSRRYLNLIPLRSETPLCHPYAVHVLLHCYHEQRSDPQLAINLLLGENVKIIKNGNNDETSEGGVGNTEGGVIVPTYIWQVAGTMRVHLYWHLALLLHYCGRNVEALAVYDEHIQEYVSSADPFKIADAASILWRLEMADHHNCGGGDSMRRRLLQPNDPRITRVMNSWNQVILLQKHQRTQNIVPCQQHPPLLPFFQFTFFHYHYLLSCLMSATNGSHQRIATSKILDNMPTFPNLNLKSCVSINDLYAFVHCSLRDQNEVEYDLDASAFASLTASRAQWETVGGSKAQREVLQRTYWHFQLRRHHAERMLAIFEIQGLACAFPQMPYYQKLM